VEIHTFASGSGGNCSLVVDNGTAVLIDAGISARAVRNSLASLGYSLEDLTGIFITHEHGDHIKGLATLLKGSVPGIYAPRTVANYLRRSIFEAEWKISDFPLGEDIVLGGLTVRAFPTPHDAAQCVGYRIEGSTVLGYCTDCGYISQEVLEGLLGVKIALIESNYDPQMLMDGPYPVYLKRRILSDRGHMSNSDCGKLALTLAESGTKGFILAHLSKVNNNPGLALHTVSSALAEGGFRPGSDVYIAAAPEKDIFSFDSGVYEIC